MCTCIHALCARAYTRCANVHVCIRACVHVCVCVRACTLHVHMYAPCLHMRCECLHAHACMRCIHACMSHCACCMPCLPACECAVRACMPCAVCACMRMHRAHLHVCAGCAHACERSARVHVCAVRSCNACMHEHELRMCIDVRSCMRIRLCACIRVRQYACEPASECAVCVRMHMCAAHVHAYMRELCTRMRERCMGMHVCRPHMHACYRWAVTAEPFYGLLTVGTDAHVMQVSPDRKVASHTCSIKRFGSELASRWSIHVCKRLHRHWGSRRACATGRPHNENHKRHQG